MARKAQATVELDATLVEEMAALFPGMSPQEVVLKSVRKAVAEVKLKIFAAQKQAELQAEERRLNEELARG